MHPQPLVARLMLPLKTAVCSGVPYTSADCWLIFRPGIDSETNSAMRNMLQAFDTDHTRIGTLLVRADDQQTSSQQIRCALDSSAVPCCAAW